MGKIEDLELFLELSRLTMDKVPDYGDGKWITIGGRDRRNKLSGKGVHVFVKGKGVNAVIVKGPASMVGKKMKHLLAGKLAKKKKKTIKPKPKPAPAPAPNPDPDPTPTPNQKKSVDPKSIKGLEDLLNLPTGTTLVSKGDFLYTKTGEDAWDIMIHDFDFTMYKNKDSEFVFNHSAYLDHDGNFYMDFKSVIMPKGYNQEYKDFTPKEFPKNVPDINYLPIGTKIKTKDDLFTKTGINQWETNNKVGTVVLSDFKMGDRVLGEIESVTAPVVPSTPEEYKKLPNQTRLTLILGTLGKVVAEKKDGIWYMYDISGDFFGKKTDAEISEIFRCMKVECPDDKEFITIEECVKAPIGTVIYDKKGNRYAKTVENEWLKTAVGGIGVDFLRNFEVASSIMDNEGVEKKWQKNNGEKGTPTAKEIKNGRAKTDYMQKILKSKSYTSRKEVADALFESAKKAFSEASDRAKQSFISYTGDKFCYKLGNMLRGFVSMTEDDAELFNELTNTIAKCKLKEDRMFFRGITTQSLADMLNVKNEDIVNALKTGDCDWMVGNKAKDNSFLSCGSASGTGFEHEDVHLHILCPAGTEAMFIDPISKFGGAKKDYGEREDYIPYNSHGAEFETLLNRGTTLKIHHAEAKSSKLHVYVEVTAQKYSTLTAGKLKEAWEI